MKTLIEIAKNGKQMAKMAERGKKWPKWQKILQFKAKSTYISYG